MVSSSSSATTIRPSWLNWVAGTAGQAQPRPAQDRVPEPQPAFPAVAGQQRAGGVEGRAQAAIVMAFECRPPDAGGGVPEVDLGVVAPAVASVVPSGLQATSSARSPQGERPDEPAGLHLQNPAGGGFRLVVDDGDLGPVGTEGQAIGPRGPAPAGPTGRQVVDEELAIPRGRQRFAGCPG